MLYLRAALFLASLTLAAAGGACGQVPSMAPSLTPSPPSPCSAFVDGAVVTLSAADFGYWSLDQFLALATDSPTSLTIVSTGPGTFALHDDVPNYFGVLIDDTSAFTNIITIFDDASMHVTSFTCVDVGDNRVALRDINGNFVRPCPSCVPENDTMTPYLACTPPVHGQPTPAHAWTLGVPTL
ncbi:hypothetical protein SPRG_02504 [Saprolegnia parasitica CBS 223.65]|uniref:Uncharacterized protein n=1 Tax=Saprolegnia parasitica (strain CBS 223.65) TaxID=695850 RepID=A0A067D244_SAPPC|nr:hypothetical protein SPRG_02504 [Saprolegnia parasitica CBS 223.65]KDO32811.1 hypothetical protein SPRG_02504 [Saprolegnia parasitica CBS 223.65]|eukprot:XP_012196467.1 hypothetical protein SPRG_02504 [Saprolegnia parasitica CBS 223.65]